MTEFKGTMHIAASGLKAQGDRLRIVAQNLANAESTAVEPGGEPYRRKTISFQNVLDRKLGLETVEVARIGTDPSAFTREYDPSHPAADENGYLLRPNVNSLVEVMDMREAQRSYEANLKVIELARNMAGKTLELLQG
ncbi:MAG: flagellar basal body rod protein FlgC [Alphaproteobacteria bacterium]